MKNCTCYCTTTFGIRKGNINKLKGKPYSNKIRNFKIGCHVHDKSLLHSGGILNEM